MDFPHTFYGHYEDIGPKDRMEDAPMVHEFPDHSGGIFGVFDGHGGPGAANFVRDNIDSFIMKGLEKKEDRVDAFVDGYKRTEEALSQYLKKEEFPVLKAKYDIDENYEELDEDYPVLSSGTTACVCMLDASRRPVTLTVANLGDCKAVLNRGGRAICLTSCHNLKDPLPEERARVMPYFNNGQLGDYLFGIAVTRSLGDLVVATGKKNEGLISDPEVIEVEVEPVDRFLIIASDGIFEVMDPQTAVETVRLHLLGRRSTPGSAAYTLVKQALARGTVDNVCAIVVMLHDYRFGLKAVLNGGSSGHHNNIPSDDNEDEDEDEFDISKRMDVSPKEGRFGSTLNEFTKQLPVLPTPAAAAGGGVGVGAKKNDCMIVWAAGDPHLIVELIKYYGIDNISWVHSFAAGVDKIIPPILDSEYVDRVTLTNARGAFSSSLAEYSLMCILHFNKKVPDLERYQRDKIWRKFKMPVVKGKTVGFVGFGSIAQETAKVCKPLGMRIVALRNNTNAAVPGNELADEVLNVGVLEEKNKLFRESDFIICSLPGTAETKHFCGSHEFCLMRPSAVFISIGRGVCVDEDALYVALSTPHRGPASAALDVFENEPLNPESKLWTLGPDKMLISSHCADYTDDYVTLTVDLFRDILEKFVSGVSPTHLPNRVITPEITVVSLHSTHSPDNQASSDTSIDEGTDEEGARSWTMVADHHDAGDGGYVDLASVKIDSIPSSGSIIEERERRLALMLRENACIDSDKDWAATVRDLLRPDSSTLTMISIKDDDDAQEEGEKKVIRDITKVKTRQIIIENEFNDNNSAVNLSDLVTEESVIISSSSSSSSSATCPLQRRTSSLDDLVRTVLRDMGCAAAVASSSVAGTVSGRGATSVADIKELEGCLADNTCMESLVSLCRRHPLTTAFLASMIVYHLTTAITAALVKRRRLKLRRNPSTSFTSCSEMLLGGAYRSVVSNWIKTKIIMLLSTTTKRGRGGSTATTTAGDSNKRTSSMQQQQYI
ncbi:hypothetical protein FOL47_004141 [Perkinsus chesapeaki]|uniref:PPM-type phosphatase domain-containing protein n=1 Tax=Perkinsus chesapeaki TaxID=330153 RepID=A0A7J6M487_PERCH|nr:hypothetical protein FOL47_004141 [Perkinsus chesapeaki]